MPKAHTRSIYAISWSPVTGRIVSCGGDGKIVVYEEVERGSEIQTSESGAQDEDTPMTNGETAAEQPGQGKWRIVTELEGAHGVFEINHVLWAKRYKDKRSENDEIIVSCGDDSDVVVWVLEE